MAMAMKEQTWSHREVSESVFRVPLVVQWRHNTGFIERIRRCEGEDQESDAFAEK